MATDLERLVVRLEASLKGYENQMKKAGLIADTTAKRIETRFQTANAKLNALGSSASGLAKGFVGGLAAGAVAEFTNAIQGAVASVAQLKAEAQQAGIGVEAFQRFKVAATQAKVGTDALTDGLKELQLRADEFAVTGKGPAAEAFTRIGLGADQVKAKLKDAPALFLDVIGRIQQLDRAAQIRVLDEVFGGTAGENFIRLVDLGADKIRTIGDEADAAGRIIDTAMVERAAELDRKFNAVAETLRTKVVSAVVSASDALTPLIQQSDDLGRSLQDLYNNPSAGNFNRFMFGSLGGAQPTPPLDPAEARRESERARALSNLNRPVASAGPASVDQSNLPPTPDRKPNLLDYDPSGRGSSRVASTASVNTERQAVEGLILALEKELELVGASDEQRAVANNLRTAGASATEAEKTRIEEVTRALYQQTDALEAQRQAAESFKAIGTEVFRGLVTDLQQGASALDAMNGAVSSLTSRLIEMATNKAIEFLLTALVGALIPGGGGIGSAIGAALGQGGIGRRASGGPVAAGTPYLVGERGPEIIVPRANGMVIPNSAMRSRSGSGSPMNVVINNTVSDQADASARTERGPNADQLVISVVKKGMARGEFNSVQQAQFGSRRPKVR